MAGLLGAAKTRLNKAGDADRDPADLTTPTSAEPRKAGTGASSSVSAPDSDNASVSASGNAGVIASSPDSTAVSETASRSERGRSSTPAASASPAPTARKRKTTGKPGKKPARRVGRPTGPDRVMVSVRLLVATNDALTAAVEDTGMSPQYVMEEAAIQWLTERGYYRG